MIFWKFKKIQLNWTVLIFFWVSLCDYTYWNCVYESKQDVQYIGDKHFYLLSEKGLRGGCQVYEDLDIINLMEREKVLKHDDVKS